MNRTADLIELNRSLIKRAGEACAASQQIRFSSNMQRLRWSLNTMRNPIWGRRMAVWSVIVMDLQGRTWTRSPCN